MANIRKISYLSSVKSGEDLGKQLVVVTDEGVFFQSYNTIIAKVWSDNHRTWNAKVTKDWAYSKTTKTYSAKFLERYGFGIHCANDVELALKNGSIELIEGIMTFED